MGAGSVGTGSVGSGSVGSGSVGSGLVGCGSVGSGSVGSGGTVSGGFVGAVETVGQDGTGGVIVPEDSVDGAGTADVQPHSSRPHSKKDSIRFKSFTSPI